MRLVTAFLFLMFSAPIVAGAQSKSSAPSPACLFSTDSPPKQLPGEAQDPPYHFCVVSDYEQNTEQYRRQILNLSKQEVRFDWREEGLVGTCPAAGTDPGHPECLLRVTTVATGKMVRGSTALFYDYRRFDTDGYFEEGPLKHLVDVLESKLEGYIHDSGKLVPVKISLLSRHEGPHFIYAASNESKYAVRIYWRALTDWRNKQPDQYKKNQQNLQTSTEVRSNPSDLVLLLPSGKTFQWTFEDGDTPAIHWTSVDVHGSGDMRPDLSGRIPVHLPAAMNRAPVPVN